MSKKEFVDGTILLTGEDAMIAFKSIYTNKGAYKRNCSFCKHEGNDEYCTGCSVLNSNNCCSCHINAPCDWCINCKFDVSPYLINYENIKGGGKRRWECFKGNKDVFEKLENIEKSGLKLTAETLTTGEIAMYIEDIEKDYEIEICEKADFKTKMCEMILGFKGEQR
ncbi:MAG: hypothetical protein JXA96_17235 [Sedimentisphaerales bacterium]|nr:hypothetical protein [Sedimentisphaerales bacterium]